MDVINNTCINMQGDVVAWPGVCCVSPLRVRSAGGKRGITSRRATSTYGSPARVQPLVEYKPNVVILINI